jgi:hypothetical protein
MAWSPGNYWAYRATFQSGRTIDIALIVHSRTPDGFRLGSNLSAGFFGLPFNGNVTAERNPRVAGEEWPLFREPLSDGATWSYHMFGHDATTTAHAAMVDVPGGRVPGYRFESRSLGQLFARYGYAPSVGWLTSLSIIEPTNGTTILDATLLAYGEDWGSAYYVEHTIRQLRISYPTPPGSSTIAIPPEMEHIRALLSVQAEAGLLEAKLYGPRGEQLADARAVGTQAASDRASVRGGPAMTWTLDHTGVGAGSIYLEITGLSATGKLSQLQSFQSTRPDRPQTGQVTSTGSPVAT